MEWTQSQRGHWPAVALDGPLDEAAERLLRLTLFERPELVTPTAARLGVLGFAGRPPATVEAFSEMAGVADRSLWEMLRRTLAEAARSGGAPGSLVAAVEAIQRETPITPQRGALLLHEVGATTGVLHPLAVLALARLWGLSPQWRAVDRRPDPPLIVDDGWREQRSAVYRVISRVTEAGVTGWEQALRWAAELLPRVSTAALADLLEVAGLGRRGSPIIWSRGHAGRLLRPVQRTLAGAGPQSADSLHEAMLRTGRARLKSHAHPASPGPKMLLTWAHEHPAFHVSEDEIDIADPRRRDALLTLGDRVIVDLIRAAGPAVKLGDLQVVLAEAGACSNLNAAKTYVLSAPYLEAAGRGVLVLRSGGRATG